MYYGERLNSISHLVGAVFALVALGALLVGASTGRALASSLGIPAVAVHHMEGHLLAPMLEADVAFPFVALLVSGGHTQLVAVDGVGRYRLLGESLDDAAGEAFDKTAKLLGLPYPGVPQLASLAQQGDILPLEQILQTAREHHTGRVLETELEREGDRYVYEIELLDESGQVWELEFDAATGELLKREQED